MPTALLSLASFSNLIITNIGFQNNQIGFEFQPLYFIYALHIFGFAGASIITLIYKLINRRGIERIQVLYILIGFGIAFANAIIINILLQNIVPVEYFRFGIYGFFFFIVCTAYAILKHHLMDIKVIATEALTFFILLVLLVEALFSTSLTEFVFRQLFFVITAFLGCFLIRSVIKEVEQRKEVQRLAVSLSKANSQLRKLDQSKTEFISIASHQLRTPLAVTKGYVSMMLEGSLGKVNEKIKEALKKMNDSNEHLIHLVETMLNISRIETGRIEFIFKKTDILSFTKNVIDQFEMQINKRGMKIKVKVLNKIPKFLIFDSDKMGEVFVNLIDNAIKYGEKGNIEVTLENKKQVVEICVIDHGIGIRKDDLDDIFTKFKRGVNAAVTEVRGSGLGLYICRKLIESHGGKIWAESKGPGKGARFCIHLPKDPRKTLKAVDPKK